MSKTTNTDSDCLTTNSSVQKPEMYVLPVSFSQQRLWLLDQLTNGGSQYNISRVFKLTGDINHQALYGSFNALVRRHEVLRTCFKSEQGQPLQVIYSDYEFDLPILDFSHLSRVVQDRKTDEFIQTEINKPFDLRQPPLIRAHLLNLGNHNFILCIVIHHVIADGWSMGVINRELSALYQANNKSKPMPLAELPIQYADYAVWQQEWSQTGVLEDQLSYWTKQLEDYSMLDLPLDYPRPAIQTLNGSDVQWVFSSKLIKALREYSKQQGVTLFMALLACLNVLLQRYSHQDDIIVGAPIAGRNRPEVEGLIGFFVNSLVLRSDLSGNPSFNELLARTRDVCLDAYSHQDMPFEMLVEKTQASRDLSRNPIFQVAFVLQNTPESQLDFGEEVEVEPIQLQQQTSKFDLTWSLREHCGEMSCTLNYNTDLFKRATVEQMLEHFQSLLEHIVLAPERSISQLTVQDYQSHQAEDQIVTIKTEYPRNQCVHKRFEHQVEQRPDAIALQLGMETLTYRQLNNQANELAHYLLDQGVATQSYVCISLSRSFDLFVSMLAILKAGAIYVPLDENYPVERLSYMLKATQSTHLITQTKYSGLFQDYGGRIIYVDKKATQKSIAEQENLDIPTQATDLAYVMFTSGSTGEPKGVEIPHRGIMRLVCNTNYATFNEHQRHLQLAPVSFDASTFEIWGALLNGARCYLYPQRVPTIQELRRTIDEYHITTLWLTSSLFNMIVDEAVEILAPVKQLLVGGEALSVPHVRRALQNLGSTQLINGYGPTENTTFTCTYLIPAQLTENQTSIPIGKPIANTEVYVLDERLQPAANGLPGELYIGGDGLARGYMNNPEATASHFVSNPFSGKSGDRLYKTGDRVRILADGEIDFIGRIDHQVKIRGHRIEPAEVEVCLGKHDQIKKNSVRVVELARGKELVAYVEPCNKELSIEQIKSYLSEHLPEYIIPSQIFMIDQMPLTPNGKIDFQKLPMTTVHTAASSEIEQPQGAIEEKISAFWCELLDKVDIGRHDDFFSLGGHSLLATRLIARIAIALDEEIPLKQLFTTPTIAGMADYIKQSQSDSSSTCSDIGYKGRRAETLETHNSDANFLHDEVAVLNESLDEMNAEEKLIRIWQVILDSDSINRDSHFFESGGHSLLGVKLVYEIEKAFKVHIPLSTLFENPVLHQLASVIESRDIINQFKTMVAIKPEGTRKPFFCIHGRAEALARYIDHERPLYWLHHKQDGTNSYDVSVEDIAGIHLAEIKRIQPTGPYLLGGFSIGGMLACEISRQLEECGEKVDLLALFDPTPPSIGRTMQSRMEAIKNSNGRVELRRLLIKIYHFLRGRCIDARSKFFSAYNEIVVRLYCSKSRALPPDLRIKNWILIFKKMARRYRYVESYSKIVIFTPEGNLKKTPEKLLRLQNQWQSIAKAGLEIRTISGCPRHSQIVEEPYVQDLMEQLNTVLDDSWDK